MQIFDIRIFEDVPFEDYLKLPGLSYSAVRDGNQYTGNAVTDKMKFGSLVDAYVFEPHTYSGENYQLVTKTAARIIADLGPLIRRGKRQLAVTCTMVHQGFYLYYKGRLDLLACNLVIDLKVSEMPILQSINVFRYDRQLNGYAIPTRAKGSLLYTIHPKTLNVQKQAISNNVSWWQQIVLKYGKPC